MSRKSRAFPPSPFRRFNSSPEVIRLAVMMYVRFPLSLRNVEDLLAERGIDIATRRYGYGGTGLARCSPAISAGSG
jgi:putative transposase